MEWEKQAHLLEGKEIKTVYVGGGTPALFDLSWIPKAREVTVEANPANITEELLDRFKSLGINRLSIGVQSLDDAVLKTLGREHTAQKAKEAVELAATYFPNLTIDLMYEIPGQTLSSWEETLSQVADLPIQHLSLYNLTFEPGTVFYKKRQSLLPLVPKDETNVAMLELAVSRLEQMGLKRYEISAFGRPSQHNIGYWTARPFLGFGPSAFSHWEGRRFRNERNLRKYAKALQEDQPWIDFEEKLPEDAALRERLAVNLRLLEGVNLKAFPKLTDAIWESVQVGIEKKLLEHTRGVLKLTEKGTLFYDDVGILLI